MSYLTDFLRSYFKERWNTRRKEAVEPETPELEGLTPEQAYRKGFRRGHREGYWKGAKDGLRFHTLATSLRESSSTSVSSSSTSEPES